MKDKKSEGKFRTITLRTDVYDEFEKLRVQEQTATGLAELSWTNFVSLLVQRIERQTPRDQKPAKAGVGARGDRGG
jgi:hypothetical protein